MNEIKEETIEESLDNSLIKKKNLIIIIPDNSNDEIEPSTSGSSNVKISPISNSSLILTGKNKYNLFQKNLNINKNKYVDVIINNNQNNQIKVDELCIVSSNDIKEENSIFSLEKSNILKRPATPIVDHCKNIFNFPLTCENKNINKKIYNYNFETKNNDIVFPKEEKNIKNNENIFNVGYKNIIKNKKQKSNSKNNLNQISSVKKDIFGVKIEPSLDSISNNLNEKIITKSNNNINKNNYNIKNRLIKNKNLKNDKKEKRPNSMINKNIDKKPNSMRNNKINNNEEKNYSSHKKRNINYLSEKKINKVHNQLETEINNLFKILPDNYEEFPEIKNNFDLIVKNIHGLKEYIYKNTHKSFRKKFINSKEN